MSKTVSEISDYLDAEIDALQKKFLDQWLPALPSHAPSDFQYDVKTYCVLAHAAFEEFVEELSLLLTRQAKDAWLHKKYSRVTVAFLMFYRAAINLSEDEQTSQIRIFDQVRTCLDDAITKHSIALANNHGFSLQYLRGILTPVGIDIPDSVKFMESLKELAVARGSYAHSSARLALFGKWKQAKRPMTPDKAAEIVADCRDLCKALAAEALALSI